MRLHFAFTESVNIRPEEVRAFIPAALRIVATHAPIKKAAAALLTDERAKPVWREIKKRQLLSIKPWDEACLQNARGLAGADLTPADMVGVVFFDRLQFICDGPLPMTKAQADDAIGRLRSSASLLEDLSQGAPAAFNPELAAALDVVRAHLEKSADAKEQQWREFIVDRTNAVRGKDNLTRVKGRLVSSLFKELFGSPCYGTAATVTSLLTGAKVARKDIENYTRGAE